MDRFVISLKNKKAGIEILTTRVLLAIAGVASVVYAPGRNYYAGIGLGIFLFLLSFFAGTALERYKLNRFLLLGIAALLTFITTGSIIFAAVLLLHGIFFQLLNKTVKVEIDSNAVTVHYVFFNKVHEWNALQNLILKDGILTVDFKNDRLLQSEIADEGFSADEKKFNEFCLAQLQKNA